MLEPFGEVGAYFSLQLLSRTQEFLWLQNINAFPLSKKSNLSCWKKKLSLPLQKTKWPVTSLKQSNLESIPPYLLHQEQQQHFKNGPVIL